jgi:hypothetical protein
MNNQKKRLTINKFVSDPEIRGKLVRDLGGKFRVIYIWDKGTVVVKSRLAQVSWKIDELVNTLTGRDE